jgi:hypothetical protein
MPKRKTPEGEFEIKRNSDGRFVALHDDDNKHGSFQTEQQALEDLRRDHPELPDDIEDWRDL